MLGRFINFFRFDFLFRLGDTYLPFSTRTVGVFVGASGLLIAAGIAAALIYAPASSNIEQDYQFRAERWARRAARRRSSRRWC